ncbi:MAG: ABC transporter permease [Erysipelotrichaceae bacterium]|nr:ABC transporter permease [Erysipelotrichaceae bacterium]
MDENMRNIPKEKLRFATKRDLYHDSRFETKPVSYFQGAFNRFCKNKGAVVGGIVISILVLFAILAPLFTPFQPKYYDMVYSYVTPKNSLFVESGIDFWDGCKEKNTSRVGYLKDLALAQETGREVIKHGEYEIAADGSYVYRYDTYYGVGFGKYKIISPEEYKDIQRYQNETGIQVLYPIVKASERPTLEKNKYDANIYYEVEKLDAATIKPKLNSKGEIVPNYWEYAAGEETSVIAEYNSLRIEGENGFKKDGDQHYYVYGRRVDGGIEVRAEYYEYYIYQHNEVIKDGITKPSFLFGTTQTGKDIFACLAYGARFSFLFATTVAICNFVIGVIWGSISGYFGGKIDLFMERFSEILGSVPSMIVITLLKYHMGTSSQALVLFIAFFATGWIGMAGRTRMQFYRFKNQEYVLAARTLGARDSRIMFKHIFPNGLGTIVTSFALVIPSMIYSETSLSYLGIINLEAGNMTSVGTLIAAGQQSIMANAAYVALFPCAFLVLLMLSFNLFGNGLRDAFNPSLRGTED